MKDTALCFVSVVINEVYNIMVNSEKVMGRLRLKCDDTRTDTRFRLSAKRTSPFKSEGVSVQSTTGSRGVRISGSNAGYTMFRGSVKGTGYPLHSSVFPSLPPPVRHISIGVYRRISYVITRWRINRCRYNRVPLSYITLLVLNMAPILQLLRRFTS